jgi:hypothetical protein
VIVLMLICGHSGLAGAENEFDRQGLYVRGGAASGFDVSTLLVSSSGVGVGGAVGYRLHPRLAVEGQFEWLGDQTFGGFFQVSRWDFTGNAKAFLATGRFQPYFVAGMGYANVNGFGSYLVRAGGGLDVYITRNVGLYIEAAYMAAVTGAVPDYGTAGVGAIFAF